MPGHHVRETRPQGRPRAVAALAMFATLAAAGGAILAQPAAAATQTVTVNERILENKVLKPGASLVVPMPQLPADATSVKLVVAGQLAWRPTQISVCSGSKLTAACKSKPVLTTPVTKAGYAHITLPVLSNDRNVTLYNTSASVSVTIRLASYSRVVSGATPPPSSATVPTTTPKPSSTASATPSTTPRPTANPSKPAPTTAPAPAPKPTATVPPAPSPAPTAAPPTGKPGPTNTGVPAGTKLTVHEGDLKITEPNTVIDSMEIRGTVFVRAPGVVIKRTLITGRPVESSLALIMLTDPSYSVKVEDSELYAKYPSPYIRGVIGQNFTLTRVNIHDVTDQMVITGSDVVVQDSWLHDNLYFLEDPVYNGTPTHDDNAQIAVGNNIKFLRNTLEGTHNAAIQVTSDRGLISNLLIAGNWINDGGCAINLAQNKYGGMPGVVIRDNVFTHTQRFYNCAVVSDPATIPLLTLSNNRWTDGTAITVTQRVGK